MMAQATASTRPAPFGARTDMPFLSVQLDKANLLVAAIAYAMAENPVHGRETWLAWPSVSHLETLVDLMKSALLEADDCGEYKAEGRRPIPIASIKHQRLSSTARREAA